MKIAFASLLLLTAAACGSSGEYPKDDFRKDRQPPPPANFYIEADDVMEFDEGRLAEHQVKGVVPEPGTPVLTVERLPEGASLTGNTFRWAPPVDLSLSLADVERRYTTQRIRVTLKSSADESSMVQKTILLFVRLDLSLHNQQGR